MIRSYSHAHSVEGYRAEVKVTWQSDEAVPPDWRDAADDIADQVIAETHEKMAQIVAAMRGKTS